MMPNLTNAGMNASEEQILAYLDGQIASLKLTLAAAEEVIAHCSRGIGALEQAPAATLANISEVVGALGQGLRSLLQANMAANRTSLREMRSQLGKLEEARQQRSAKVHLGGFVPVGHPRRG